jgi:hypothetical protein
MHFEELKVLEANTEMHSKYTYVIQIYFLR